MWRYLSGTKAKWLAFGKKSRMYKQNEIELIVDAEYAGDTDSKSRYGFIIKLNGDNVQFATRKQKIEAVSSTEAEYVGIVEAMKSSIFVESIVQFCRNDYRDVGMQLRNDVSQL